MPPPYYWRNHARAICRIVFTDDLVRRLWTTRDGDDTEYATILNLVIEEGTSRHMKHYWVYYGVNVMYSLPSPNHTEQASNIDASYMMSAALAIELCQYAIGKPLPLAVKIVDFVRFIIGGIRVSDVLTKAFASANRAYSLVHQELQTQLLAEKENKKQAKLLQHRLEMEHARREKEHALRMAKFEEEQQLRHDRAVYASLWLMSEHNFKECSANIIRKWYYRQKFKHTIAHRIKQRTILTNKRLRLQSICLGASTYANNIKASRPPRASSKSTTTAPPSKPPPTTHTHPFRDRGLPLKNNTKRRQRNRRRDRRTRHKKSRPRNRPPRKFRNGPSSIPMVSILPSCLLDTIKEAVDAPTTASSDSTMPSTAETVCHSNNNDQPIILPLWFWAAQTSAAIINLNIGNNESLVKPPPNPTKAASTIQHMYRRYRYRNLRMARAASTLQQWFKSHQYQPSHCTADISVLTNLTEYPKICTHKKVKLNNLLYWLHLLQVCDIGKFDNSVLDQIFCDRLGISWTMRQRRLYCYRFCWG